MRRPRPAPIARRRSYRSRSGTALTRLSFATERNMEIERENRLLLEKMSMIVRRPARDPVRARRRQVC